MLYHLVRVRQPDRVVPVVFYRLQNVVVILRPQSMHNFVGRLKSIPVDARQVHSLIASIQYLVSAGMQAIALSREPRASRAEHYRDHRAQKQLAYATLKIIESSSAQSR
jgi:hypothetical protein